MRLSLKLSDLSEFEALHWSRKPSLPLGWSSILLWHSREEENDRISPITQVADRYNNKDIIVPCVKSNYTHKQCDLLRENARA